MQEQMMGWEPVQRIIGAVRQQLEQEGERLDELLDKSDKRLCPLGDPLRVDFGAHRWLRGDREEAYSDWLAWILKGLGSAGRIFRVLGLEKPEVVSRCGGIRANVKREQTVTEGHRGKRGRIDIVVNFEGMAVIGVEVKRLARADRADTGKHPGYKRWLEKREELFKDAVLIAIDGERDNYSGFTLRTWAQVCLELRRMSLILRDESLIVAAMILAFVGAAEQNILALRAHGRPVLSSETSDHLESWLLQENFHAQN